MLFQEAVHRNHIAFFITKQYSVGELLRSEERRRGKNARVIEKKEEQQHHMFAWVSTCKTLEMRTKPLLQRGEMGMSTTPYKSGLKERRGRKNENENKKQRTHLTMGGQRKRRNT